MVTWTPAAKLEPLIVKKVPPVVGPKVGDTVEIVGAGPLDQENALPSEADWPSGLITETVLFNPYALAGVSQVKLVAVTFRTFAQ